MSPSISKRSTDTLTLVDRPVAGNDLPLCVGLGRLESKIKIGNCKEKYNSCNAKFNDYILIYIMFPKFTFDGTWIIVYAHRFPTNIQLIVNDINISPSSHRIGLPGFVWGATGVWD